VTLFFLQENRNFVIKSTKMGNGDKNKQQHQEQSDEGTTDEASRLQKLRSRRLGIKGRLTRGKTKLNQLLSETSPDMDRSNVEVEAYQIRLSQYREIKTDIEGLLKVENEIEAEIETSSQFDDDCNSMVAQVK
jgi:hypothetical protein